MHATNRALCYPRHQTLHGGAASKPQNIKHQSPLPARGVPAPMWELSTAKSGERLFEVHTMDATTVERFWSHVKRGAPGECWEWQGRRARWGYGWFFARDVSPPKTHMNSHRVAWIIEHGPIPPSLWVCHKCDNPPCCNPDHLFLGTTQDNTADMVAKGRALHGTAHHNAKLTPDSVRAIRVDAAAKMKQRDIAAKYGVTQRAIWQTLAGITWHHVQ